MFGLFKREAPTGIAQIDMLESMMDSEFDKAVEFERSILDRLANAFDDGIDRTKTQRARLEQDIANFRTSIKNIEACIADHEEKLRQTLGATEILKHAQADLVELSDPDGVDPATADLAPLMIAARSNAPCRSKIQRSK